MGQDAQKVSAGYVERLRSIAQELYSLQNSVNAMAADRTQSATTQLAMQQVSDKLRLIASEASSN